MDSSAVATLLVSHIAQAGDMDDQSVLVDDFDAGIAIIHSFLPFEELSCDLLSLVHGRGDVDQLLAFAVAVPLEVEDMEEVAGHGGLALTKRNAVRCNWFACDPAVQVVISAAVSPRSLKNRTSRGRGPFSILRPQPSSGKIEQGRGCAPLHLSTCPELARHCREHQATGRAY